MSKKFKVLAIVIIGIVALAIGISSIAFADEPETADEPANAPFQRMGRGPCGGPPMHLDIISDLLGLSPEEVAEQFKNCTTLEEIAEAQGVDIETIRVAILAERIEAIQQMVNDDTLSQEQADAILERMEQGEGRPCNGPRGMHQRGFGQDIGMENGEAGPYGGFGKMHRGGFGLR